MLAAIAAGIALGHADPSLALKMKPLSDGFVRLIGMLVGVIVFMLVVSGIAGMQDKMRAAKVGGKAILYFEVMTLLSLTCGLLAAHLLQPGIGFHLAPSSATSAPLAVTTVPDTALAAGAGVAGFLFNMIPDTVTAAFMHNNSLQILLLAVLSGVALSRMGERGRSLLQLLEDLLAILFGMISLILKVAPLAAFGAMAFTIGKYGVGSVLPLLHFVAAIYLASLVFILVVLGLIAASAGVNILRLIAFIKTELLLVFFTTSSMAALPGLTEKMEQLGCAKPVVRLVLPTGYTFNLNGSNLYIAMAAMFLAQATGIELSLWQQLSLLAIAMLTSKGATSVTGSSFIALAATLTTFQLIPVTGIVLLLGVERLMKCRSLSNVIGNCVACLVISAWDRALDRDMLRQTLSATKPPVTP
ncbi:cation:dicarboxylate symporter family transporter [Herbaspirillum autotrophicum]|uniref:cation:dicarboxylate symporter family transporter n=1 Tax=Herbaspirillum autotrophicum TaxID=180195 RepID=UPI00067CAAD3|nr:cation:dicarboxylase symporter family transporter [Herbaspirillum autotrophicum]